jgi:hypothetical protein
VIANNGGPGLVDIARLQKLAEQWGKMPQAERAKAMAEMQDLVNGLSPEHRQAMQRYFEEINNATLRGLLPNGKR